MAYNHGLTYEEAYRTMVGKGGFVSHLGTNDARAVEAMIDNGDGIRHLWKSYRYYTITMG